MVLSIVRVYIGYGCGYVSHCRCILLMVWFLGSLPGVGSGERSEEISIGYSSIEVVLFEHTQYL